jgi:hypothetical protein
MPKRLTSTQVEQYHRDGFVAPIDVMSEEEAYAYRQRLEEAEARYPEALNPTSRNNAHYAFSFLDEIVHHEAILDAVEDIIGPDILLWGTVLFIKDANSPGFVTWHQDVTYSGHEPHDGVTPWLALSPVTPESGCIRMLPGTHKGPIRPHEDTFHADNILTRGQQLHGIDGAGAVDVVLRPGQMSLHHMRVIHSSQPNRTGDRRIGIAMQPYMPPHMRQTKGEDYALLMRGRDTVGNWLPGRRPAYDMEPEAAAFRAKVNDWWGEILYDGAQQKRAY